MRTLATPPFVKGDEDKAAENEHDNRQWPQNNGNAHLPWNERSALHRRREEAHYGKRAGSQQVKRGKSAQGVEE